MKKKRQKIVVNKTLAYIRVSTDKQDSASQRHEITKYAKARGLSVDKWFEVSISSKNGFKERKIDELLNTLKKGDVLIVSELSRLARSMKDAFIITEALFKKNVETHCIKQALILKENDMSSKVMISAFSMAAEIERDLISQRTKNGLALAKERGVKLGNPKFKKAYKKGRTIRMKNADDFAESLRGILVPMLEKGMKQQAIVDELNKSHVTTRRGKEFHVTSLQRVLKRLDLRR